MDSIYFTERHEIEYYNIFDKFEKKRTVKGFSIGNYFEVKEEKILFTTKPNTQISLFESSEKPPKLKTVYQQKKDDSFLKRNNILI